MSGRVLAIGDIHGCATALDALLDAVALGPGDLVVTLGDYVDKGHRSRDVIERLIGLAAAKQLVAIRGNHDQMMLDARTHEAMKSWWLTDPDYGIRTLASYGGTFEDVPESHWAFLRETCRDWFENETHIFVHAMVHSELPLEDQPVYVLRWEPFGPPSRHFSGKTIVCGHTEQPSGTPRNVGHAVCIDTRAHAGGWLTCLDTRNRQLWQANEAGQVRTSWLEGA